MIRDLYVLIDFDLLNFPFTDPRDIIFHPKHKKQVKQKARGRIPLLSDWYSVDRYTIQGWNQEDNNALK